MTKICKHPHARLALRHIALYCQQLEASVDFYTNALGLDIVWQPDSDNYYLSSGSDNIALHRAPKDYHLGGSQRLDHMGFFVKTKEEVDQWHQCLVEQGVQIVQAPKDHRDGTHSFYCKDPEGTVIQIITIPPDCGG